MNRLIQKKILILLAIWLLTGGLALADSFDLTDELHHALVDRSALAADLSEVRESIGDQSSIAVYLPDIVQCGGPCSRVRPSADLIMLASMRPLPEVLKTFRI